MSLAEQLFGKAAEAVKEGVQAMAPGLNWNKIIGDMGHELKQQGAHGAHELAAALFNGNQGGSAFVMYPRGTHDDHGVHGPQQDGHQQEQERGGRGM